MASHLQRAGPRCFLCVIRSNGWCEHCRISTASNDDDNDGFATQWTFTTRQSGLFGGTARVAATNIGDASTNEVSPSLSRSILDRGRNSLTATSITSSHLFTQETVTSISLATNPSTGVGGDGGSAHQE